MPNSRNKLTSHTKKIEKDQMKPQVTIRKEITKIGMEINVTKTQETIEERNEIKRLFFF